MVTAPRAARRQRTTRLTSLPGTTISLTTSLPSRCWRTRSLSRARREQLLLRGVRTRPRSRSRSLPLTWTTRVNVSRASSAGSASGHGCSQTRSPVDRLVDLGAEVRREGEDQRRGGRGREAQRGLARRVAPQVGLEPVGVVDQLHHRRDRGVELKAAVEVARHLVDRPVGLARQLAARRRPARASRRARARCARRPPARGARGGRGSARRP